MLAPSILSADFCSLGSALETIEKAGAHYVHIDVMDGFFVPNITIGMPVVKSMRKASRLVFDVHLMIEKPERYAEAFVEAGADIICFHAEACEKPHELIQQIRGLGVVPAVAIRPDTPAEAVVEYLSEIGMVLVMSVMPGFGGQALMPHTLEKALKLKEIIDKNGLNCEIEMDGGIKLENVHDVLEAGVNVIVAGSDIFGAPDAGGRVGEYLKVFEKFGVNHLKSL